MHKYVSNIIIHVNVLVWYSGLGRILVIQLPSLHAHNPRAQFFFFFSPLIKKCVHFNAEIIVSVGMTMPQTITSMERIPHGNRIPLNRVIWSCTKIQVILHFHLSSFFTSICPQLPWQLRLWFWLFHGSQSPFVWNTDCQFNCMNVYLFYRLQVKKRLLLSGGYSWNHQNGSPKLSLNRLHLYIAFLLYYLRICLCCLDRQHVRSFFIF